MSYHFKIMQLSHCSRYISFIFVPIATYDIFITMLMLMPIRYNINTHIYLQLHLTIRNFSKLLKSFPSVMMHIQQLYRSCNIHKIYIIIPSYNTGVSRSTVNYFISETLNNLWRIKNPSFYFGR